MFRTLLKKNPKAIALYKRIRFHGYRRYCPCCEKHSSLFFDFGIPPTQPRADAECPQCGSLERHRLLAVFLEKINLFAKYKLNILHVAPENALFNIFTQKPHEGNYVTADLSNKNVMLRFDLCTNPFRDNYFDLIVCNHVLEHIDNDLMAMRELHRVLSENGLALISVPIDHSLSETYEDRSITLPAERIKHFGQDDHVRIYGNDFLARLTNAGFKVQEVRCLDLMSDREAEAMGIPQGPVEMYACRK